MKRIDKMGKVFGKLTVTGPYERTGRVGYWWCKCECGNTQRVSSDNLSHGRSRSCGCSLPKITNLQGARFHKLLVQESLGGGLWRCVCDCGEIRELSGSGLLKRKYVSCGCNKRGHKEELYNRRFGRLVVVSKALPKMMESGRLRYTYLCLCDCGKETTVQATSLKSGSTLSCGCLRVDRHREKTVLANSGALRNHILAYYRKGAELRNLIWGLDDALFDSLINQPCHYCGVEPRLRTIKGRSDGAFNGIDRKDSYSGYVEGNVLPCCTPCNLAKEIGRAHV